MGFDDFHLLRSAVLLVIHTFGAMALATLSLPSLLCGLESSEALTAGPQQPLQHLDKEQQVRRQWQQAVLAFLLVRTLSAFAATVSAAIQRRHLYAWPLFAPKFVYEAAFLLGTDVVASLMCLLM